ncbi:MarR family transcriptional regulator [Stakelama sediminis]|uniref:DNA-binding MarR family transcriptional regulator n=1 Tax=Stakelama sediminis TaxID=463200 RepID=A0A840YYU3_9SPHN|nr:MarR family transcriptional regulator [Stakelama sediminis]MBB5718682.1 DNA-binding MarR family transcriptional regulator [Stakelama sediminis]
MPGTLHLDGFLPYRLSIASNRVSNVIATAYQSLFGLRIAEWRLIAVLAESDGMSQQALGIATRMDKVMVSRAATALHDRGLVQRAPNPADQRSHLLSLSKAGQDLYEQVSPKALALERQLFSGFSAEEVRQLRSMLERLEEATAAFEPQQG